MNFSKFLNAIYNRLAGLIAQGLLRRFEVHQAMDAASLRAELEIKVKQLRKTGATASAARLEAEVECLDQGNAVVGMAFVNELLTDSYPDDQKKNLEVSENAPISFNESEHPPKKRGRKSKS